MKRLNGARTLLLSIIWLSFAVALQAQDAPDPLATTEVGDVQAMAISGDGRTLFVTDARANTLHVFSLAANRLLENMAEVPLDGTPTALSSASDYALVTMDLGSDGDALESIGPDPFNASGYTILNFVDVEDQSRALSVAQDFRWALVIGERWYSLVQIVSATDMIAYPSATRAEPQSGALGTSIALIAQDSPARVVQYLLRRNQAPREARALDLDDSPGLMTLNGRATLGAVVSGSREIIIFDTATMQQLSSISLDASPTQIGFSVREDGEWLIVATENNRDLSIFDATNPVSMGEIGSLTLGITPSQMRINEDQLIVSDGQQIHIYRGF
jgi:DNA-binding beta-propeller fold protein YncE